MEFSLGEYGSRYAAAVALMDELDLDALVLAQPTTIRYMTGLQTWLWILPPLLPAAAIVPRDPGQATLIATVVEKGGADATSWMPACTAWTMIRSRPSSTRSPSAGLNVAAWVLSSVSASVPT
jgi:Xaa-Pro aminopeptidase